MRMSTDHLCHSRLAILLISCCTLAAHGYEFAGGMGEPNDPYQIATAEQIISIGSDPNLLDKHFVLLKDIDLGPNLPGGRIFKHAVIAPDSGCCLLAFSGTFNGRGHSLKNLTFQKGGLSFIGLFGNVAKGAVVWDLQVEDADLNPQTGAYQGLLVAWNEGRIVRCGATGRIAGNVYTGILAGLNRGEIIDCWAEGDISGSGGIGGLVGFNDYGTIVNSHAACKVLITYGGDFSHGGGLVGESLGGEIVNCWAGGHVSGVWGSNRLGGLVGASYGALIANSYATGNVSAGGGGYGLGGFVGSSSGTINDCYATGDVSGGAYGSSVGGLVGGASGFISDSYSIGRVSNDWGSDDVGGFVGETSLIQIEGCFWNVETSGLAESAGGEGLTTAQMQDVVTYVAAGWDLAGKRADGTADLWLMLAGGRYPSLTVHSDGFQPHTLAGAGTPEDPYTIVTIEDLDAINHYDLAACYKLDADIDLAQSPRNKPLVRYFDGRFDGANRVVTGLTIQGGDHLGLFGGLGGCASITNLGLQNASITGDGYLGLLAGTSRGSIVACRAGGIVAGSSALGVLTGWSEGSIADSYVTGSVTADVNPVVGGLTGWNVGTISRCYAAAYVSWLGSGPNTEPYAGGLVGSNQEPSGSGVTSTRQLAKLTGEIHGSYFLIETDGGGPDNGFGTPLMEFEMRCRESFVNWDFGDTWMICEGNDYPRLRWEKIDCSE